MVDIPAACRSWYAQCTLCVARLEPMASTSAVGLVQGHVSRPTHVARCWRGHSCPYHARKCCWFLHDEDGEGCARAAIPLPPASLLVRLSSLLEQIAEVLKVIQQRIVEPIVDGPVQLAEFVGAWEQIVDVLVARTMEDDVGVVRFTPQERVQNCTPEQVMDSPVPQIIEAVLPDHIAGIPCASDHGGQLAVRTTGTRAKSCCGADCGFPCASDHRGRCAGFVFFTFGARAESYAGSRALPDREQIRAVPVPQFRRSIVEMTQLAPQERQRFVEFFWECASAQDQGGCCGRYAR